MKLLIFLTITCAVVVTSLPAIPSCGSPVPAPSLPVLQAGSNFMQSDYAHGASGVHGSHHQAAGGSNFFDQKENHQKTKQVIESESSSKHNKGGSTFGSSSGGSFGAFESHGRGSMAAGSQHQQVVG